MLYACANRCDRSCPLKKALALALDFFGVGVGFFGVGVGLFGVGVGVGLSQPLALALGPPLPSSLPPSLSLSPLFSSLSLFPFPPSPHAPLRGAEKNFGVGQR